MKLVAPVNFAGRLFMPGECVKGEFPLDMIELLKENGAILSSDQEDASVAEEFPTVEEFSKLKSDEQKAILESLDITAASKLDQRVRQYEAWIKGMPSKDE